MYRVHRTSLAVGVALAIGSACGNGGIESAPLADASAPLADASAPLADAATTTTTDANVAADIDAAVEQFCSPFAIAVLPDTQHYTSKQDHNANNTYIKQTQWIVDNAEALNIQHVLHLGDLTDNNTHPQWAIADDAHKILEDASMSYSVIPGNHDYLVGNAMNLDGSHFDQYFGPDRFLGESWYGGNYKGSNRNNYTFFEAGPRKFMVLSLDWAPSKDVICWANRVISEHPEHRVIIVTHCYLGGGGNRNRNCGADWIFEELVSKHSNIFLVAAGHAGGSLVNTVNGQSGNTVYEMLVDYQFEAPCALASASSCDNHCGENGFVGNGWMRYLVFDPCEDSIHATTLTVEDGNTSTFPGGNPALFCSGLFGGSDNPWAGNLYSENHAAPDHRFDLSYDMTSQTSYVEDTRPLAFRDRAISAAPAGNRTVPDMAGSADGSFVVVWQSDSGAGAESFDVRARGFCDEGCEVFPEIVVATSSAGDHLAPAVSMDASGNFVVVWSDDENGSGGYQILARRFTSAGVESIPPFVVNSAAAGRQTNPVVAAAPNGNFVVAWEDDSVSAEPQVMFRGFNAGGEELFADKRAHPTVAGARIRPSISMDGSGNFVIAWQDDGDGNGGYQIMAAGFRADGSSKFGPQTVNIRAAGQQTNPSIGLTAEGQSIVVWEDDPENDGNAVITARKLSPSGVGEASEFMINSTPSGHHVSPSIAVRSDGKFAVIWQQSTSSTSGFQIRSRGFHPSAAEWIAEAVVNYRRSGEQRRPVIALGNETAVGVFEDQPEGSASSQVLAAGIDVQ